ncbi:hypothetical protein [Treponema sp.]|uniref:hypothetical protein n=1 Tax=Treponema sp. TaxID=166 RepID=UPI0025D2499E|nr:hypothetical protein [Treponema sp.]MBR4322745.1 hypothetical protein [Treponema sp.]
MKATCSCEMQVGNILSVSMILKDKERVRLFVFFFRTVNPSMDLQIRRRLPRLHAGLFVQEFHLSCR